MPTDIRPDLSVIIPAYNEVLTIREIIRRVDLVPIAKEILVVDDGSTDGTRRVLTDLQDNWEAGRHPHSSFRTILQTENRGKGSAIRAGIASVRGRVTIIQDADLEYDPNDYPKLVDPILGGQADVVYGSRFTGTPRRVLYFWHSLGNKVLTTASNMLTNLNLTDMESCYKAFRTEIIQAIPLREDGFGFEPEVTAKVARLGLRIYEVPIAYHGRSYSEGKKIGWRDGLEAFGVMLRSWLDDEVDDSIVGRRTLEIMKRIGLYNRWLCERLRPHLGDRVLEVGSGIGNISRYLLDKELLLLTDIDPEYLKNLQMEFGGFENVKVARFDLAAAADEEIESARLDTVLCCNVLEHVDDDAGALRRLRGLLSPGDRLVLLVPAHDFAYGSLDEELEHRRRYDRRSLVALLQETGFDIELIEHLNGLGLLGWMLNSRLLRRRVLPRSQVALVDHLIPIFDIERRFGLPFGLSLLAVARARMS